MNEAEKYLFEIMVMLNKRDEKEKRLLLKKLLINLNKYNN